MIDEPVDLLIRAGRVFSIEPRLDGPGAVAIRKGRIVSAGPNVDVPAEEVLDYPDGVLLPGLVDFHAHPGLPESRYAIEPDEHMLPTGVTMVLAQGEAGAANVDRYRQEVVERSRTDVMLALNLARNGEEYGGPCLADLREADVAACIKAVRENRRIYDFVWGISVNSSRASCGDSDPRIVMCRAVEASYKAGAPLLVGTRRSADWPLEEQILYLEAGDVLTYCYHGQPEGLVANGRVRDCVWEARRRNVRFDLGHGAGSFSFEVAETCIREGFLPNSISTDKYRAHLKSQPEYSLPLVMSKLMAAGMMPEDVFERASYRAGLRMGRSAGHLREGARSVCVLRPIGMHEFEDCHGVRRTGTRWDTAVTVMDGYVVPGAAA